MCQIIRPSRRLNFSSKNLCREKSNFCFLTSVFCFLYFSNKLLILDFDAVFLGHVRWELLITTILTWLAVFFSLRKNVIFSAHSTYCLAIIPYLIVLVLLIRSVMLDGAVDGLVFFFKPTYEGFMNPKVFKNLL